MKKEPTRGSKTGTIVLLVLLITAAIVTVGLYYLTLNTVDAFDFHLDFSKQRSHAEASVPVETAKPTPTPTPEPITYLISMVGDCTLASSQRNNDFDRVINEHGLEWPFSGTAEILSADEFTLANLECTFSDASLGSGSTFAFRGPAANAQMLSLGSVEAVTNGNNHTPDFGEQGIADTRAAVEGVSVGYVGANESMIFTTANGLKIGVYCPGWGNASIEGANQAIPALREKGADVVIYAPHWGLEGKYRPTAEQELVAHTAIDAGADIVCGTHPHVMQKVEIYNDKYIFYSLGNFSFGGNTAPRDRDSVIAQVKVTQTADGACSVTGYTLIPCCLSSTDGINDYCPKPYAEDDEGYARAVSKLDGTFTGPDLAVDYSFLYG
ncbi:MAG: CapA family protein [Ruminococcus sp.]|nr:CapA family protein [Ruminococcus sp.]